MLNEDECVLERVVVVTPLPATEYLRLGQYRPLSIVGEAHTHIIGFSPDDPHLTPSLREAVLEVEGLGKPCRPSDTDLRPPFEISRMPQGKPSPSAMKIFATRSIGWRGSLCSIANSITEGP